MRPAAARRRVARRGPRPPRCGAAGAVRPGRGRPIRRSPFASALAERFAWRAFDLTRLHTCASRYCSGSRSAATRCRRVQAVAGARTIPSRVAVRVVSTGFRYPRSQGGGWSRRAGCGGRRRVGAEHTRRHALPGGRGDEQGRRDAEARREAPLLRATSTAVAPPAGASGWQGTSAARSTASTRRRTGSSRGSRSSHGPAASRPAAATSGRSTSRATRSRGSTPRRGRRRPSPSPARSGRGSPTKRARSGCSGPAPSLGQARPFETGAGARPALRSHPPRRPGTVLIDTWWVRPAATASAGWRTANYDAVTRVDAATAKVAAFVAVPVDTPFGVTGSGTAPRGSAGRARSHASTPRRTRHGDGHVRRAHPIFTQVVGGDSGALGDRLRHRPPLSHLHAP